MDTTTLVILIIVVVALVFFMWPRLASRRGGNTPLSPPGELPGAGRDARDTTIPMPDKSQGYDIPATGDRREADVVGELEDDVRSQNPNKST